MSFSLHALPPTLLAGGALTLLALLAALLSLVWLPWPIDAVDMNHKLLPPSATHWLGTDKFFRRLVVLGKLLFHGRFENTVFGGFAVWKSE